MPHDYWASGLKAVRIDAGRVFYATATADDIGAEGGQNDASAARAAAEESQPKRQATPKVEINVEVADESKNGFLEPF